ncbi:MAG: hypothetical protein ACE5K0_03655 [Candidatus Methanofastidiosia archaeon]
MKTFHLPRKLEEDTLVKLDISYSKRESENTAFLRNLDENVSELSQSQSFYLLSQDTVFLVGEDLVIEGQMAYCFTKKGEEIVKMLMVELS